MKHCVLQEMSPLPVQEENSAVASKLVVGSKEYEIVFIDCENLGACSQELCTARRTWCREEDRKCAEIVYVTVDRSTDHSLQK